MEVSAMTTSVHDYLLDQQGVDWATALGGWSWLLPPRFTVWLVNRFCDLFIVPPDGSVHMLDVGAGSLTRLAESRDDFRRKIDEGDNANDWLMIPLVNKLVSAGMRLQAGQCYGFKTPPVLGGEYTVENCAVLPIGDYLGAYASIHEQLRDVSDGSQVVLRVENVPAPPDRGK
jgi:hypothetical protein